MYENLGYVETVEEAHGVTVPSAEYIRVITAERSASPATWSGWARTRWTSSAMTVFYCFREREILLDLFEAFCGARLTYNAIASAASPGTFLPAGPTGSGTS
jgi:NADH:ubiquinone oxidoreductase subunit D